MLATMTKMVKKLHPLFKLPLRNSKSCKIDIDLVVDSRHGAFASNDLITGTAVIKTTNDIEFEHLTIELSGTTQVLTDPIPGARFSPRISKSHKFLSLFDEQISASLPKDKVLRSTQTYALPFEFNLSARMEEIQCHHHVDSNAIRDLHMFLPPSMNGSTSDFTPKSICIQYRIEAAFFQRNGLDDQSLVEAATSTVSNLDIQPHLHIPSDQSITKSNPLPRNFSTNFSETIGGRRHGELSVNVRGRPFIDILPPTQAPQNGMETLAQFTLCYQPQGTDHHLPELKSVASKLIIKNYYAATSWNDIPSDEALSDSQKALCEYTVSLPKRSYGKINWVRQNVREPTWELPQYSDKTHLLHPYISSSDKAAQAGEVAHTANLVLPIVLPADKDFLPSFHSCLVSRAYELQVRLQFEGSLQSAPLVFKIPVVFR
jgi:hypothetical protein